MHEPPVRVPCAVCLEMIESWYGEFAQPCQHTLTDIWLVWKEATRMRTTCTTTDREDLAWVAGVFDGEGHVGRNPRRNTIHLDISQAGATEPELLSRVRKAVGMGTVRGPFGPYKISTRKPIWRYELAGFESVQAFIAMIWPWLGAVKRAQAVAVLTEWRANHRPRGHYGHKSRGTHCREGHKFDRLYVRPDGRTVQQCTVCIARRNKRVKNDS